MWFLYIWYISPYGLKWDDKIILNVQASVCVICMDVHMPQEIKWNSFCTLVTYLYAALHKTLQHSTVFVSVYSNGNYNRTHFIWK